MSSHINAHQAADNISPETWEQVAKLLNSTVHDAKEKYVAGLENDKAPADTPEVHATELYTTSDNCVQKDFSVSLAKLVGVNVHIKVCGSSSSDWNADVKVCPVLAGTEVECYHYQLSPDHLSYSFHVKLGVAKLKLEIGVKMSRVCFYIKGQACYWGFGWHCSDFDETLFCFR